MSAEPATAADEAPDNGGRRGGGRRAWWLWPARLVLLMLLLVVAFMAAMLVPAVQTRVAHWLGEWASARIGAEVRIARVAIRPFGPIVFEELYVGDLQGDTLFAVGALRVKGLRVLPRRHLVQVSELGLDRGRFALATADGDVHSNLTNLLDRLASGDTTETAGPDWTIRCDRFRLNDLHFSFHNANSEPRPFGVDFDHVDVREATLHGHHLLVTGDSIGAHIDRLALRERSGLVLEQLAGGTWVSPHGISIEAMRLRTPRSDLSGELRFTTDSWGDYNAFTEQVMMRLELDSSRLDLADVAWFATALEGIELPFDIRGRVFGTVNDLKGRGVHLYFGERSVFRGSADLIGLPDWQGTFMMLDVDDLRTDHVDLAALPVPPFTKGARLELPKEVRQLGSVRFAGNFTGFPNSFTAYGRFGTALGQLRTDLSYDRDTLRNTFSLNGRLATESFRPGPLLQVPELGEVGANIRLDGRGRSLATLRADVVGEIPLFTVGNTRITGITANGRIEPGMYNGELHVLDDALVLDFKGLADLRGRWPLVDFNAYLQHIDMAALGLLPIQGYNTISMLIDAEGRLAPDSLEGRLDFRAISYCNEDGEHDLGDVLLTSGVRDGESVLGLQATFADAEVVGRFLPTKLPAALTSVVYSVFPALREEVVYAQAEQAFRFLVTARQTGPVLDLFVPGLAIDSGSTFRGSFDSRIFDLTFQADMPGVDLGPLRLSQVEVVADKTLDVLAFGVRSARQQYGDSVWFAGTRLIGKAYQDDLEFALGWDDSNSGTNGRLDLLGEVLAPGSFTLELLPSQLFFGRGNWTNERSAYLRIDSSTVRVDSLILLNEGQRIALDGTISRDRTQALAFDVRDVSLENLTPFLNGPVLKGWLEGDGRVYDLYDATYVVSHICLDSVRVQDIPVGDLLFSATWAEGQRAVELNGELTRGPIKALDFNGRMQLEDRALDLSLVMDRFDLAFIDPYLPEGISEIQGQVTGTLKAEGTLVDPQISGVLDLVDAGMRIDYLNTLYRFSHRVLVEPDMFAIDFVTVRDEEGNTARMGATILHNGLKDWNYNVWGTMDRLLVLNTTIRENDLYYGRAYGIGDLEVSGSAGRMDITVDARTGPGTDIHFPIGGSTEVSPIGFVRFLSGDSLRVEEPPVDLTGISLDMNVEVTPDAVFELIFDPTVGDILTGRGRGNMEMTVSPNGDFVMRGQVEVADGDYLFTLRNVGNKRFQLMPGGRIVWYGDPFDAQLDLSAIYRVRAPLYDIMFDKNEAFRRRVPIEVVMNLQDKLLNPEIRFDVRLPTVDESIRTQVNSVLSTEQEMNRQVFALIVLNRFVQPPFQGGGASQPAGGMAAGTTTSELLSNQVSNWLSRISSDFDLGINYRPGDNITQDELEVAVSTQLFDERLLLSTNVGVQYGAAAAASSNTLVGDFQVEYLLTNDGKLRLKAFSVSNDRNLNRADQALTTQGAGLAYRREADRFLDLFRRKARVAR